MAETTANECYSLKDSSANILSNVDIDIIKKYLTVMLVDSSSGVVIAGFNMNEFRPSYIYFDLITKYKNEIIISDSESYINSEENLIVPFAQDDVTDTFISGINNEFIDFLAEAGQKVWQMLPLVQTGYGNSPYSSVSANSFNPYFISPEELVKQGLLCESPINKRMVGYVRADGFEDKLKEFI